MRGKVFDVAVYCVAVSIALAASVGTAAASRRHPSDGRSPRPNDVLLSPSVASVSTRGAFTAHGPGFSTGSFYGDISSSGRYVVFESPSSRLDPSSPPPAEDYWGVFLRDNVEGTTKRIDVAPSSRYELLGDSHQLPRISDDGRYVITAEDVLLPDGTIREGLFRYDRVADAIAPITAFSPSRLAMTSRLSVDAAGDRAAWLGWGRLTNGSWGAGVWLWSQATGKVRDLVTTTDGQELRMIGGSVTLSADGRQLAFVGQPQNLVSTPSEPPASPQLYTMPTTGTAVPSAMLTPQSDLPNYGVEVDDGSAMSGDGRYVAYTSRSTNITRSCQGDCPAAEYWQTHVFAWDRESGAVIQVDPVLADPDGAAATIGSDGDGSMSTDGSKLVITYRTDPVHFAIGVVYGTTDTYLADLQKSSLERFTVGWHGGENISSAENTRISGDGQYVVFDAIDNHLVPGDNNDTVDVFDSAVADAPSVALTASTKRHSLRFHWQNPERFREVQVRLGRGTHSIPCRHCGRRLYAGRKATAAAGQLRSHTRYTVAVYTILKSGRILSRKVAVAQTHTH